MRSYNLCMRVEYREEPCKSALNRVKGMMFDWSLNPYMGCVHRCTFCYVRAFERRADRPSDDRYGQSIRVKINVVEVLRRELARAAREAGACGIWANLLFLKPGTREHFLENLAQAWPDELERYERLYRRRAYLGKEQTKPLREHVHVLAKEHGVRDRRNIRLEPE